MSFADTSSVYADAMLHLEENIKSSPSTALSSESTAEEIPAKEAYTLLARRYSALEGQVIRLKKQLHETEQKNEAAKREKANASSRLSALLNFLPGGVIVLDESGRIAQANPAAESVLSLPNNYSPKKGEDVLTGRLWRDVISERFSPRSDDGFEVSTKAGKRISISTSSIDVLGQIVLLTDQTETRRLQQNLSRFEKLSALGKMVSALAHQIRTPLSAALLYSGHLKNPALAADRKAEINEKIHGRLVHMEKQVRDMMLFVKSELPLNDQVTLSELKNQLHAASEAVLDSSGSQCSWLVNDANVRVKCNLDALVSGLMNLVNNGIQAAGSDPQITIALGTINDGTELEIAISDNGPGMTDEQLLQSKELFYTTKEKGTGLGLTVVQSIVKAHGGRLDFNSEANVGTTAKIIIPINI